MAVTSLWRIKGTIREVVDYAMNPEKTTNPSPQEQVRGDQALSDVIQYAMRQSKTGRVEVHDEDIEVKEQFVTGVNCLPSTAVLEMEAVKMRFGKEDGTVAYHGYQSFAEGEVTAEIAHEIGVKLAAKLWGEKYQVVVTTHLDKESHLHNHFAVNTVSFVDGKKFYRSAKDYHDMQTASDALCREYGLSVVKPQGRARGYDQWQAEKEKRPVWRDLIRADMDEAIRQSMTERQFFDNLRKRGYEIKVGKDISVRPPGKERFLRLARNFGEGYTIEGLRRRILRQQVPERPARQMHGRHTYARVRGYRKRKKVTGLRALYYYYCYRLGVFQKDNPKNPKQLPLSLREDLQKLEKISKEVRLLTRNGIETAGQLSSYKGQLEAKISTLAGEREALYRRQRTVAVKSDDAALTAIRERVSTISGQLRKLRREVKLCEDIFIRSAAIKEKLDAIREDQYRAQQKDTSQSRWNVIR